MAGRPGQPPAANRMRTDAQQWNTRLSTDFRSCPGGPLRPLSGYLRRPPWCITSAPRSRCSRRSWGGCASSIFVATRQVAGEPLDLPPRLEPRGDGASDPVSMGQSSDLFFAVYGRALQAPLQFGGLSGHHRHRWMSALVDAQGPDVDPATATRCRATLVIATIRGLLLDLLATGDRDRVLRRRRDLPGPARRGTSSASSPAAGINGISTGLSAHRSRTQQREQSVTLPLDLA